MTQQTQAENKEAIVAVAAWLEDNIHMEVETHFDNEGKIMSAQALEAINSLTTKVTLLTTDDDSTSALFVNGHLIVSDSDTRSAGDYSPSEIASSIIDALCLSEFNEHQLPEPNTTIPYWEDAWLATVAPSSTI